MSCKSALSNSIKSNSDHTTWIKSPTTAETNIKFAGEEAKDRLYEPKHKKKLVRVLTVVAYVFSVSLAAIMLSLYYIFIWNPNTKINKMITDGNNEKVKCNCHEIVSEALKQMKTEDAQSLVSAPTFDTDPVPSWQTTTEDSAESLFDEASSETKIDDNNIPMDNTILNYESDSVSNETIYK